MNNKSDGSREKIFYSCHDLNGVFEEQTLPKGIKNHSELPSKNTL